MVPVIAHDLSYVRIEQTPGHNFDDERAEHLNETHEMIAGVGPPSTNSGMLGIFKDLDIIAITSCGHY